ncbi:hypothetical protein A0257_14880 [Hymenobacter psoromatis]|nr:hypothetical protein A0257_14880 [Hymenobacter psoromatis]
MIPQSTLQGILPPFIGGDPTFPDNMSPYRTTMQSFVQRFGSSPERLAIIRGLLDYRAALLKAGLTGFQWLSGSFVEDVESIRGRPPKDIDVVSVINRPLDFIADEKWVEFLDGEHGTLLTDAEAMKKAYQCDAYAIDMNEPGIDIVNLTRYWFGLFSHQRVTSVWKGMVVVALDSQQDEEARTILFLAATSETS